jgi:two-component sensor histidine kinase
VRLVSELVTNSVRYSRSSNGVIELLACVTPTVLRVEVSDDGEGFGFHGGADEDTESGRGLQLVGELADRWGHPTGLRSSVWFELDRAAARVNGAAVAPTGVPTIPQLRLAT